MKETAFREYQKAQQKTADAFYEATKKNWKEFKWSAESKSSEGYSENLPNKQIWPPQTEQWVPEAQSQPATTGYEDSPSWTLANNKPSIIISNSPAEILVFDISNGKTDKKKALKELQALSPEEIAKHPELVKLKVMAKGFVEMKM